MKKIKSVLSVIFTFLLLSTAPAYGDDTRVLETVERYNQALQAGDVEALKTLLGGRLYKKRRVLLEENTEYSDWLKRYYAGASFSDPSGVRSEAGTADKVVEVETRLGSGERVITRLILQSAPDTDEWQIVGLKR